MVNGFPEMCRRLKLHLAVHRLFDHVVEGAGRALLVCWAFAAAAAVVERRRLLRRVGQIARADVPE